MGDAQTDGVQAMRLITAEVMAQEVMAPGAMMALGQMLCAMQGVHGGKNVEPNSKNKQRTAL
jgi:hypothetical protein